MVAPSTDVLPAGSVTAAPFDEEALAKLQGGVGDRRHTAPALTGKDLAGEIRFWRE
jgi:hypothetical protein